VVRGRKPIAEREQVRDMRVTIRLSEVEYRYLQALAMKQGLSVGVLVRARAVAGMPVSKAK
jgi:hypothetical protein